MLVKCVTNFSQNWENFKGISGELIKLGNCISVKNVTIVQLHLVRLKIISKMTIKVVILITNTRLLVRFSLKFEKPCQNYDEAIFLRPQMLRLEARMQNNIYRNLKVCINQKWMTFWPLISYFFTSWPNFYINIIIFGVVIQLSNSVFTNFRILAFFKIDHFLVA